METYNTIIKNMDKNLHYDPLTKKGFIKWKIKTDTFQNITFH